MNFLFVKVNVPRCFVLRGITLIINFLFLFIFLVQSKILFAAVGCSLRDPDRDIMKIFPQATGYKTEFITIEERGGKELAKEVEGKLGDKLDSVYETMDVPYSYYFVLKRDELIGYVHGVNQKGMYGGLQLILATNLDGEILSFYYQKIYSPQAKLFKSKSFCTQFTGLSLMDFYDQDFVIRKKIKNPSKKNEQDFLATIRGLKKNLILLDEFILDNKYDKYWVRSKKED